MNSRTPKLQRAARFAPTARSETTRARILEAAQVLFNERGTAAVSTNHIAAEAGISPGNLHYHYADKKEIVRALHAGYAAALEGRWQLGGTARENLARLNENLLLGAELAWKYRFFEREILALLRADPELRAAYRELSERRLGEWLAFGEQLVAQGALRPPRPPYALRELATALWLIAQGWQPYLDLAGDPEDPDQVARGTELILVVLDPYMTPKGRRALAAAAAAKAPSGKRSR